MQVEIKTWLYDIKNCIEEIDLFVCENGLPVSTTLKDVKTRKAVERNLSIIGKAMNRILTVDGNFSITNGRKIVDTRNRIIHGYDKISTEVL